MDLTKKNNVKCFPKCIYVQTLKDRFKMPVCFHVKRCWKAKDNSKELLNVNLIKTSLANRITTIFLLYSPE